MRLLSKKYCIVTFKYFHVMYLRLLHCKSKYQNGCSVLLYWYDHIDNDNLSQFYFKPKLVLNFCNQLIPVSRAVIWICISWYISNISWYLALIYTFSCNLELIYFSLVISGIIENLWQVLIKIGNSRHPLYTFNVLNFSTFRHLNWSKFRFKTSYDACAY